MSKILTCLCGAKVRLPERRANRSLRCPQCKSGIAVTSDGQVLAVRRANPRDGSGTCLICQTTIAANEAVVTCPECEQFYHHECWSEIGGCGKYGCGEAPQLEKEAGGPATSAWGDTKRCPVCGEMIKAIAVRCRYCRAEFDTVDPLTMADISRRSRRAREQHTLARQVMLLFGFSFLGCFAPIMLLISLLFVLPNLKKISAVGSIYTVMAYSSILLSGVYSLLILVFMLMEAATA